MSQRPSQRSRTALGRRLWRPADTTEFVLGLLLAVILPCFAAWMAVDLQVFDHFPGVPFLAATVGATLVGRLSASLIATLASGVLVSAFAGRERVLGVYAEAVARGYLFYSFGDAMLIA